MYHICFDDFNFNYKLYPVTKHYCRKINIANTLIDNISNRIRRCNNKLVISNIYNTKL